MSRNLSSYKSFFNAGAKPLVVVDDAIPFIAGVLEPWFTVRYVRGGDITAESLRDAVALLVRTRTKCDASLLDGSSVEMIATATIGTDHIDFEYCKSRGIAVESAPGCNSGGVCQYVFAALKSFGVTGGTLGVIGTGHVGTKVAAKGRELGFNVLCNDIVPSDENNVPLDRLLSESDVVTIHIPLKSAYGTEPQYDNNRFAGASFFSGMKSGAVFINASRGEVLDDDAFLRFRSRLGKVALDVWRNEPDIDGRMLAAADIATPHIAGYSIQGKMNGTGAAVRALGRHFHIAGLSSFKTDGVTLPDTPYDILADDAALRRNPESFEKIRSGYSYRNDLL